MKKRICLIAMAFVMVMSLIPASVSAENETVTVYSGSMEKKIFSKDELDTIASSEGSKSYNYSGMNTYGNYKTTADAYTDTPKGPTIKGILEEAGIATDSLAGNTKITFKGSDGFGMSLSWKEISEDRYFYPNGAKGTSQGQKGTEESKEGEELVPMILDTEPEEYKGVLRLGQLAPNEQSWPVGVKYMLGGSITVGTGAITKLTDKVTTSVGTASQVQPNQIIKLNYPEKHFSKIYYTVDGTTPNIKSDIYNYDTYSPYKDTATIKAPATDGKTITIKTMSKWYGYLDSDVQTFTYTVQSLPLKGKTYVVGNYKYRVTKSSANSGTVSCTGMNKKSYTYAKIPSTVKIKGYSFKITNVGAKAFYKYTKLKKVEIGSNISSIGTKAFYGDKRLKVIKVTTKQITSSKKIGSNAFKGIYKKAKIYVTRTKYSKYKKYFSKKGQSSKTKIIKY